MWSSTKRKCGPGGKCVRPSGMIIVKIVRLNRLIARAIVNMES